MTEMSVQIAVVGFMLMLMAQTGAMFYWGGNIARAIKDHDRRLNKLEDD